MVNSRKLIEYDYKSSTFVNDEILNSFLQNCLLVYSKRSSKR